MSQQTRLGTHATSVSTTHGLTCVKYHTTDIVIFSDKMIVLDNGGWQTSSTKTRMNQASNQFDLGFHVYQKDGNWFVGYKEKTYEYVDRMILER